MSVSTRGNAVNSRSWILPHDLFSTDEYPSDHVDLFSGRSLYVIIALPIDDDGGRQAPLPVPRTRLVVLQWLVQHVFLVRAWYLSLRA